MVNSLARHRAGQIAAVLAAILGGGSAIAQQSGAATTQIDNSGNYASEVRSCNTGRTSQDRETCLTEAARAQAARKNGHLDTDTGALQTNALQRCAALTSESRAACVARMTGHGNTSGSVAGGGILRAIETVVVPADAGPVTIAPRTDNPVILVPDKR